jgi:hypothetical protein
VGKRSFPNALRIPASAARRFANTRNLRFAGLQGAQIPMGKPTLEGCGARGPTTPSAMDAPNTQHPHASGQLRANSQSLPRIAGKAAFRASNHCAMQSRGGPRENLAPPHIPKLHPRGYCKAMAI